MSTPPWGGCRRYLRGENVNERPERTEAWTQVLLVTFGGEDQERRVCGRFNFFSHYGGEYMCGR